jgi:hypothetical protein
MMMNWTKLMVAAGLLLGGAASTQAQSVGGVFGPTVDAGDRALELRLATILDEADAWGGIARLHYQRALNDSVRLRGVAQIADLPGDTLQFRHLQLEMLWQTVERTPRGYESGFRFDVRLTPQADRAERLGVNWIHQWRFGQGWRIRAIARANAEFGAAARAGVNLGFRSSVTRRLGSGLRLGLENFSRLGNSDRGFGRFDDQRHTVGPMIRGPLTETWEWYSGLQLGVSDAASDRVWQFRLTRTF